MSKHASITETVGNTPVVKIKVRVPACGKPGEPIEYRIRVDNCSPADAHHVVVKNALPPSSPA